MNQSIARTNFDFIGKRIPAVIFSCLLVAFAIYQWITLGDRKYGIDFLGGNEFVVDIQAQTSSEDLEKLFEANGVPRVVAQSFEAGSNDWAIRFSGTDAKEARQMVDRVLSIGFPGKYEVLRTEFVGPVIGEELQKKALIAVSLGLLMILAYVAIRFEFSFALGAVVALFHDVVIATGVYLFVGHELTMSSLAAALTIVGYSVNDTIVIFDRLREEMARRSKTSLATLMNEVMNAMLSRTIITSLLTLFSALALMLVGGGAIADLSVYLVAGLICGSYSTIYIAAPVVLWWESFRGRAVTVAAQA